MLMYIYLIQIIHVKMAKQVEIAPSPKVCPVNDCQYVTPSDLPNYELVYKDINMHLEYSHPGLGGGGGGQSRTGQNSSKAKPDKLPRPEIGEGATEADWVNFLTSADLNILEEILAHAAQTPNMDIDMIQTLVEAKETYKSNLRRLI